MKVRATAKGFYGNRIREEDDVFDVPEGTKGSWLTPMSELRGAAPAKQAAAMPTTIEEAMKLTNIELTQLLQEEEIKFIEGAPKKELAKTLIDGMAAKELV